MIKIILNLLYVISIVFVSIYFSNQIMNSYISNFGKGIHVVCILIFMFGTFAWLRCHQHERKE